MHSTRRDGAERNSGMLKYARRKARHYRRFVVLQTGYINILYQELSYHVRLFRFIQRPVRINNQKLQVSNPQKGLILLDDI